MSKYDGDIRAAGRGSVELGELLAGLGRGPRIAADRHDALAQYLSGADGWRDALAALGGKFAPAGAPGARLTAGEDK